MSTVNIDWKAIRPLNGSSANGFEELCAWLAKAERPASSYFERKGPPDAGVECYAVLSDGHEWGWQAKYFDGLSDSQWSQLDGSVKTALEKHPRLIRYFICVPLNRSDARLDGRRSGKERWDEHVQKWQGWAAARGMAVEFVYWGSSELLERLARPQHVAWLRFWFDVRGFDRAWFTARLDEALKTARPRYPSEIHVDLPIAAELDAFGRTEQFFDRIKAHARNIRTRLQSVLYPKSRCVDPALDASASALVSKAQAVLAELGAVTVQPIGVLPFQRIADQVATAEAAAEALEALLSEREREYDARPSATEVRAEASPRLNNSFRECRYRVTALSSALRRTHEALVHAETVAGRTLLLLKGAAGTGKTHLLCDVARQRVAADRPTVLLLGQRFVSADAPWPQALQQLDLQGLSAEEFVGALEAAARASGCRALVLIDAINEGSGRRIWPSHLAAFLAHLERSPWIGVLLSVRSSYEEIVVPEDVRARAVSITHQGFAGHEYDATRTFFIHYGLELPSTPLLAPEFRNPLFLKTLCHGLNVKGARRLPRGFSGITAVFDLYLTAVNGRLASTLGFNPKDALVRRALEAFARMLVDSGEHWLTRVKAEEAVNALLPGREFERSLYRGLVVEGVLVEEAGWRQDPAGEEVVFLAYDRFADHLVAKTLLDAHLEADAPAPAFAAGAPLAFLWDERHYIAPGLLEAMCIQIPERTGQELVSLAPQIVHRWGVGEAFRQSLIWRRPNAFLPNTGEILNTLIRTEYDLHQTFDVMLTVATLPEHPFNANFLDQRLRKDPMPERDAWWSTYLHYAWGNHGAVDRLVDWASSLTLNIDLEDETVDLCAITLAWMLTTSNRFLRDRATKALVSLLTGRLGAVVRLVEHFAEVDEPYLVERIYAVAYGTAMRSHDPAKVGALAARVYTRVFASGAPPAHILLRDYARGVVERAIYLGAAIPVDEGLTRPPYNSQWPAIPTEDDIAPLLPDWSRGSYDSGGVEWARHRIGSSVMHDDFAHSVMGTNSSNWLSLRLDEPSWQSPAERLARLLEGLSEAERAAWEAFKAADDTFRTRRFVALLPPKDLHEEDPRGGEIPEFGEAEELDSALARAEQDREAAVTAFESVLTEEHVRALEPVLKAMHNDDEGKRPPRFDLRLLQWYVLWRVFDLGWTTERFGDFDRYSIGYHGREASKAERIGKKYQWIAYHEIIALVADHFQYRERFRDHDGDRAYDGPWQGRLRDIDPSCTLRTTPGGTSLDEGHTLALAWRGAAHYETWGDPSSPGEWVICCDDLPRVENLLRISHPENASRWLNVEGSFRWEQRPPADRESIEIEQRELVYVCTGYLIRARDADAFMEWAEGVDFRGLQMPEPLETSRMFLGEHGWSPASRYVQQPYDGDEGWTQPDHGCPVRLRMTAFEYLRETSGFDCSVDEGYTLRLPTSELVTGLGLRWNGNGADYDAAGQLAACDPTAHADGPSALLLREDLLREFLAREGLTICWAVRGEKRVHGAGVSPVHHASLRLSGAYRLNDKGPVGFLKCMLGDREMESSGSSSNLLATIRSPR